MTTLDYQGKPPPKKRDGPGPIAWVVILVWIVVLLAMSGTIDRTSNRGALAVFMLIAYLMGVAIGWALWRWRVPLVIGMALTPVVAAAAHLALWFLWVTITIAVYGDPVDQDPVSVGMGAVGLYGCGIVVIGALPSYLGALMAVGLLTVLWGRR